MAVFDELKEQAKKSKDKPTETESGRGQRPIIQSGPSKRMDDLHAYFKEFQQQLTLVDPEIRNDFSITGLCVLKGLRQGDYQLTSDNPRRVRKFTFHYSLAGKGVRELELPNRPVANQIKETLWRNGFKFKLKASSPTRCSLWIEAFVPVSFEFEWDEERASVHLKIKNKPAPGISSYTYDADRVDAEFMDETAKYILNKPNDFDELSGKPLRKKP